MKRMGQYVLIFLFPALLAVPAAAQEHHQHPVSDAQLGEVHFANSCADAVQDPFNRAVATLHSFGYNLAATRFREVIDQDPGCAMAYWGLAMTYYHPLWEAPGKESLQAGAQAIEKAQASETSTQRERDYIAALATFYRDFDKVDHLTRVRAYEQAMQRLHSTYPDDTEAAIFYALSLLGTASAAPPDPALTKQKQAGAILAKLFADNPNHPGLAHYIIHSYDYPPLAAQALDAARRYAGIAPDSPHALHMPSHIFTRLGLWDECIASNLAAAASGRKHDWPGEAAHASDYLVYAYLQLGQDQRARQVLEALPAPRKGDVSYFAGLYANAAAPARYVLERHNWKAAAQLKIPNFFPGGRYAWTEATFHFARGLGAARTGDFDAARASLDALEAARNTVRQAREDFWADQVEVQRLAVAAWLAFAEDNREQALEDMRAAADLEDRLGKHPVTPGAIIPARELLGEMLLAANRPADAEAEFEAVLRSAPNRLNAFYGLARAAEQAGDTDQARAYYRKLADLTADGDSDRPAIKEAQAFLVKK